MTTIFGLLSEGRAALSHAGIEDPLQEARLILSSVLKKNTAYLMAHPDDPVAGSDEEAFRAFLMRRTTGEPFHYITGSTGFISLPFMVNQHVLIPRSDTELLAEAGLYALGHPMGGIQKEAFTLPHKDSYRMLDIGSGSGCLSVSVAYYAKNVSIDAIDISAEALEIAAQNAEINDVGNRIAFKKYDILNDTGLEAQSYDLILSNPPYIPEKDKSRIMPSVRDFEPHVALFGGDDGLIFYRKIAQLAPLLLKPHGIVAVECGIHQWRSVMKLFEEQGMEAIFLNDLAGIERVVSARVNV